MSYTELHTGKLQVVKEDYDKQLLKLFLEENEGFYTDYPIDEAEFIVVNSSEREIELVYNKGTLYMVLDHTKHEEGTDPTVTTKNGDEVSFVYQFYNGGTCFEEVLEEGLNNL